MRKHLMILLLPVMIIALLAGAFCLYNSFIYAKIEMPSAPSGPKPAYIKQRWKKARTLTWANPGASGDYHEPTNWLENGIMAINGPARDTDILLPRSDMKYYVFTDEDDPQPITFRHATVDWNARLISGNNTKAYGNIWIKKAGRLKMDGILNLTGNKHTFCRNDNPEAVQIGKAGYYQARGTARHVKITKSNTASVELIGRFVFKDEFSIYSGIMICGPNSEILPGGPSTQRIYKGATLEIQSGALFSKKMNQYRRTDILVEGTLQAGSPERPLVANAYLGLSQAKAASPFISANKDAGIVFEKTAKIKVFTAHPDKARLVIKWHGFHPAITKQAVFRGNTPLNKLNKDMLGTEMIFCRNIMLENVEFDDVRKGGIYMPDPSFRDQWENIRFGKNNYGKPEELFSRIATADEQTAPEGINKDLETKLIKTLQKNNIEYNHIHTKEDGTLVLQLERSNITDISFLKGFPISELTLSYNHIKDISPLRGMPLTLLRLHRTPTTDISALKSMPLKELSLSFTKVSDLEPLKNMKLEKLDLTRTLVHDLSPLRGMPIRSLFLGRTEVKDISLLKDFPLEEIGIDNVSANTMSVLKTIEELKYINKRPAEEFIKH